MEKDIDYIIPFLSVKKIGIAFVGAFFTVAASFVYDMIKNGLKGATGSKSVIKKSLIFVVGFLCVGVLQLLYDDIRERVDSIGPTATPTTYEIPSPFPPTQSPDLVIYRNTYFPEMGSEVYDSSKHYSVGDYFLLGSFEQNDINDNEEWIEWRVLKTDGDRALAISKYGLVYRPYQTGIASTWKDSELREYLNGEFYQNAFLESEKEKILQTKNENNGINSYNIAEGDQTIDYVFCLSITEAQECFFIPTPQDWTDRICEPTIYATNHLVAPIESGRDRNPWWLRSPGHALSEVACVRGYNSPLGLPGAIVEYGYHAYGENVMVRPAIWVSLASNSDSY